jgi:cytochrome c oxidase assembly protein subunit 15
MSTSASSEQQSRIDEDGAGSPTPPEAMDAGGRDSRVSPLVWRLAIANLVAQIGIIVTGGLVRVTGSGLGCSDWPYCEPGNFTPVFHEATSYHPYIEFGNRTLTGVLGVIAVALIVALWWREPTRSRPRRLRAIPLWVLVGIGIQAVIGGITVHADLHPAVVGIHMYCSLFLVAVSAYLLVRLRGGDGPAEDLLGGRGRLLIHAVMLLAVLMTILGTVVTGAGPHSGDDTHPYRWPLDPLAITRAHAFAVYGFIALLVVATALLHRLAARNAALVGARRAADALVALCVVEAAVGIAQHSMGLPAYLVVIHMGLAGCVVAATAWLWAATYRRSDLVAGAPLPA